MSYNISHTEYVNGVLSIDRKTAIRLKSEYPYIAESNFLDGVFENDLLDGDVQISNPWWCGEFSGNSYGALKEILSFTKGTATILLVWEGGDNKTALKVKNGKVTEAKVKMVIEEEE